MDKLQILFYKFSLLEIKFNNFEASLCFSYLATILKWVTQKVKIRLLLIFQFHDRNYCMEWWKPAAVKTAKSIAFTSNIKQKSEIDFWLLFWCLLKGLLKILKSKSHNEWIKQVLTTSVQRLFVLCVLAHYDYWPFQKNKSYRICYFSSLFPHSNSASIRFIIFQSQSNNMIQINLIILANLRESLTFFNL